MLHARKDYNRRVQDNENIIGENEPVFLLRAKDKLMVPMLYKYFELLRNEPHYDKVTEAGVYLHICRTKLWQSLNKIKAPDTPEGELV